MTTLIYQSVRSGPIAYGKYQAAENLERSSQKISGADGKGLGVELRGDAATRSGPSSP
jgi:hypothetical protein